MSHTVSTTKYIIHGKVEVEGIVEKPDVVGAVFGQSPITTFKHDAGVTNAVFGPSAFIAHLSAISSPHPAQHELPGKNHSAHAISSSKACFIVTIFIQPPIYHAREFHGLNLLAILQFRSFLLKFVTGLFVVRE